MKKGPGRPPQTGETRDKYIQVRASLSEKAVWMLAAEVAGQDFSPFSRETLNQRSTEVLGLTGPSTTTSHLADLLGKDDATVLQTALLDGETVSPNGRIRTKWALSRIACDADPTTAAPGPYALRRHRKK